MSIIGKISVAPCGHKGEAIIGTYVKCLAGCDSNAPAHAPAVKTFDPNKMIITFKGQPLTPASGAPMTYTPVTTPPNVATASGLEAVALTVKGVAKVHVEVPTPGLVYIDVLRLDPSVTQDPNWKKLCAQIVLGVRITIHNHCGMGTTVSVLDRSPMFCLDLYAAELKQQIQLKKINPNAADYYKYMMDRLLLEKYTNLELSTLAVHASSDVRILWAIDGQNYGVSFTP